MIKKKKKSRNVTAHDWAISPWHDLSIRPETGNCKIDDELDVISSVIEITRKTRPIMKMENTRKYNPIVMVDPREDGEKIKFNYGFIP